MTRRVFRSSEIQRMADLYRTHTAPEIAQIMDIKESSVISALHRNGIKKTSEELGAVLRRTRPKYKRKHNALVDALRRAGELIQDGDRDQALAVIRKALAVQNPTKETPCP